MSDIAPHSLEGERALIGTVMLANNVLDQLLTEVRVRPEHFYNGRHRLIFQAMVEMFDEEMPIDHLTLVEYLQRTQRLTEAGGRSTVEQLCAEVPATASIRTYAENVVADADWRNTLSGAYELQQAALTRDQERRQKAEGILAAPVRADAHTYDGQALAESVHQHLMQEEVEVFPTPWAPINYKLNGGLRRGEVMLLGGWTSHGKSVAADQIIEHNHQRGARCRTYINEMTARQRALRSASRLSGVNFGRMLAGTLTTQERDRVVNHLPQVAKLPPITDAAGLSAEDIARSIRRARPDVALVDILHLIDYADESDLRRISRVFKTCAIQADCVIVATIHLNERRASNVSAVMPRPGMSDIKGSSSLKQDASVVAFVHRQQDPQTGEPLPEGELYLMKNRDGELGGVGVRLNPHRIRFETLASPDLEAVA